MFYVKQSEKNAPYLEDWSNEQKDGYKPVPAIMDSQIIALTKFTDKCFLNESGALITPNQVPLSEQERQRAATEAKIDDLKAQLKTSVENSAKQQQLINYLTIKLNSLGAENGGVK